MINKYPYTDFNEYNLDWLIVRIKELTEQWAAYKTQMDSDWLAYKTGLNSEWAAVQADWSLTREEFIELRNYVSSFFDNLDVQQEINNKLDEMAADGSLLNVIRNTVETVTASTATTWLNEHVNPATGYVIDNTLTISGAAADAKAAGDKIKEVKNTADENKMYLNEFKDGFKNKNLFIHEAVLLRENAYAQIQNGVIFFTPNNDMNAYLLPVEENTLYSFTEARFAFLVDDDRETALSELMQYKTLIDSSNAPYICFTVNKSVFPLNTYQVVEGSVLESGFITPGWFNSEVDPIMDNIDLIKYELGNNLFQDAILIAENKYAQIDDGHILLSPNNDFNAYLLPVLPDHWYTFKDTRFAFLVEDDGYTTIGDLIEYQSRIYSGESAYICFSFNKNEFSLSDYYVVGALESLKKPQSARSSGSLSDGDFMMINGVRNSLQKGESVSFTADITTFSSIHIGNTYQSIVTDDNQMQVFVIDANNVSFYQSFASSTPLTIAHGLTISNNIQVIIEEKEDLKYNLILISDGNLFEHDFSGYKAPIGNPFILSDGSSLTGCNLSWTCEDLNKKIWIFGDSYVGSDIDRWVYYLNNYGYGKNTLINGAPGEGSVNARNSFINLLKYGTPKYVLWCVGMNDGGDTEEINADWLENKDIFISYCKSENIEPIFGTVPTVPNISHELQNEWIRSSGYRYVDFAKAVGSQADGTWFSGMLSNDNIHPTEAGAKALFAQALNDLPELMITS